MAKQNLFKRLGKLFSTDVVIRNVGGNQIKVMDNKTIQANGKLETNSIYDRYNRLYSPTTTSLIGSQSRINYSYVRPTLYSEYDSMDQDAIVASSLDIIADESTLKNDLGEVISIKSPNADTQKILHNLFYDVLNIEFNLWSWTRQMCKYGDFFLKLEIAEQFGVYNVLPYNAYHIERQEGYDIENPTDVRFKYSPEGLIEGGTGHYSVGNNRETKGIFFENYEVAHFRLISDVNYLPYGRSYIEPARKLFKQYSLMEDAMLIHRITRAPEKRAHYINIGAIPPNEVESFMQQTISKMKRTPVVDEKTGDYNLKYNMMNMMEDYYIPTRGNDASTKIETLGGLQYDGIQDVEYLRDKLFAALKVPKAFLGYEKDLEGKATLAAEDIRFARTIERIQRILVSELNKIALVHLYSQGYRGESLTNFELSLNSPSIIFEQEKIELLKSKTELASSLVDQKLLPTDWIYNNIFNFSEDEFEEYRNLLRTDAKRTFRLAQIENEGNDPIETGKSYGTPHDLASLYGKGRTQSDPGNVPDGYNEDPDLGRPKDSITKRNTQDDNFGKDRLGVKRMKDIDKNDGSDKGMMLESAHLTYLKNEGLFKNLDLKKSLKDTEQESVDFMDESKLRE